MNVLIILSISVPYTKSHIICKIKVLDAICGELYNMLNTLVGRCFLCSCSSAVNKVVVKIVMYNNTCIKYSNASIFTVVLPNLKFELNLLGHSLRAIVILYRRSLLRLIIAEVDLVTVSTELNGGGGGVISRV